MAKTDTDIAAAVQAVMREMQAQPQGQQIVNSFVNKAANVYNAPVTIEKQDITF